MKDFVEGKFKPGLQSHEIDQAMTTEITDQNQED